MELANEKRHTSLPSQTRRIIKVNKPLARLFSISCMNTLTQVWVKITAIILLTSKSLLTL